MRFQQWMLIQASCAALSHGCYTIPERLARWVLMVHDRLDGDELPLVHQFLAMMLGVRRSGVTDAVHILEGKGAIRATRGNITVLNREVLQGVAGGSYGVAEAEYERLLANDRF
jgi:CRP-like cAMP-binding protein